ncbi:phosphoribosylanthranilate isomerase [Pollutimonas sp. H1-120]|uniref:phosphoribosylanthranilate isomerase n=1 Tax=Pollutimonas sp. H1-120 TaxID=3148824 RepID=UPI003B51EDD9
MTPSLRTRVKICGLTRLEDIDAAAQAGADAIGFVFYGASKRCVDIQRARLLRQSVPAFISVTALFVNAPEADVRAVIEQVQPDLLQFHGDETPQYCESFGRRYLRAFRVGGPGLDTPSAVLDACRPYASASAWLFDSYSAGYGGSGLAFDSSLLRDVRAATDSRPMVLAGGLKPESLGQLVREVRPYAVDVSSGVETAPGIKSAEKIGAFMQALRAASENL